MIFFLVFAKIFDCKVRLHSFSTETGFFLSMGPAQGNEPGNRGKSRTHQQQQQHHSKNKNKNNNTNNTTTTTTNNNNSNSNRKNSHVSTAVFAAFFCVGFSRCFIFPSCQYVIGWIPSCSYGSAGICPVCPCILSR